MLVGLQVQCSWFDSSTELEHSKLVRFEVESQQRGVLYPLLLAKMFWVNKVEQTSCRLVGGSFKRKEDDSVIQR